MYILAPEQSFKRFGQNLSDIAKEQRYDSKVWTLLLCITRKPVDATKKMLPRVTKVLMLKLIIYWTLAFLFCLLIYRDYQFVLSVLQLFWKMLMHQLPGRNFEGQYFPSPTLSKLTHQLQQTAFVTISQDPNTEEFCLTSISTEVCHSWTFGDKDWRRRKMIYERNRTSGSNSNIWGNGKDFLSWMKVLN